MCRYGDVDKGCARVSCSCRLFGIESGTASKVEGGSELVGLFQQKCGIFRPPSTRTSRPKPSTANSCWSSRARGGGDAGSLTPRCSATVIRCTLAATWKNTSSLMSRPHHHQNNNHNHIHNYNHHNHNNHNNHNHNNHNHNHNHNHFHHHHQGSNMCRVFRVSPSVRTLAVDLMNVERVRDGGESSTRRRWERRLRWCLQDERMAIAMAFSEAQPNSAQCQQSERAGVSTGSGRGTR